MTKFFYSENPLNYHINYCDIGTKFKTNGDPQVRVFIFITWYKGEPAWTHALEGPHEIQFREKTRQN